MTIIIFATIIFLSLIEWIIFFDVILSWAVLLGIHFQPRFVKAVTIPLYDGVRRYIPTTFWGIDFAPIIIFLGIEMITKLLMIADPGVTAYFPQ